jgi:hypothetical protein
MNSKRWLKTWIILIALSIPLLISVNYIVDPLNILHTKFLKQDFQTNERFLKVEYLDKNNFKYNSYLFGSSRIGTTNTEDIEKYIPNSKFYNLTISSGNFYDYLYHLKYFIKKKYPIKNIYLQIDIGNMGYYGNSNLGYLGKLYPPVVNESLDMFYIKYLTSFLPMSIKGKIQLNMTEAKENENHISTTGIHTSKTKEQLLISNCKEYVKNEQSFHKNYKRIFSAIFIKETIEALKNIQAICKDNNITLYVFTTPINKNMMDTIKVNDYFSFLKAISIVTDFYDFSGYNSITMNNCNYYEYSHYRPLVGKLIAGRIFNDTMMDIPSDFGVYVTKSNIDEHILDLKEQIKRYDLNKILLK